MKATMTLLVIGLLLAESASAQAWIELGDAPSYPDGPGQITRGELLNTITGSTGGYDLRDAYCIRIVTPDNFLATTDPSTAPAASANFDTRLFLFRADGAAVLANDDSAAQPTFQSTLTGVATDGSGFVLSQPGDYVLIVGGDSDDPKDILEQNLFAIEADLQAVHAPVSTAGLFDHWEGGTPATGSYTIVLSGATHCQNELDAVFCNWGESNQGCFGTGTGEFDCTYLGHDTNRSAQVALGFVDGDPHPDLVFANVLERNRVCFGNGLGAFTCRDVSDDDNYTLDVALGFIDGDQHLDAVFVSPVSSDPNRVCLGSDSGHFTCSDLSEDDNTANGVALGFIDGDSHLDAVLTNFGGRNQSCFGKGSGAFTCSDVSQDENFTQEGALGLINNDQHLDAVFANGFGPNRVCLGNGSGAFTCSDVSNNDYYTGEVALGFIDGDQHLDAVFVNAGNADSPHQVCLGSDSGVFTCSDFSDEDTTYPRDVALGFIDEDQYLDAVFSMSRQNRVCFGNGSGAFTCGNIFHDKPSSHGVVLGELATAPSFPLFADGFESGDTSAWSNSVP